jgi:F0F1-type ATP synthase membrane subunit b/b'
LILNLINYFFSAKFQESVKSIIEITLLFKNNLTFQGVITLCKKYFYFDMHYSQAFWVAVSFLIFIIFVWSFIRKAFLSSIKNYRNEISSELTNLLVQRSESENNLQQSITQLNEANLNNRALNAHKIAKNILEQSKNNVQKIKSHTATDVTYAAESTKVFLQTKARQEILSKASRVLSIYLHQHSGEFMSVAVKYAIDTLKKQ